MTQLASDVDPGVKLYVPAAQSVQTAAPPILYLPASQCVHVSEDVAPTAALYLPAGQSVHVLTPCVIP